MADSYVGNLSENMQMYLVSLARLQDQGKPVPLSRLAGALEISPISVNEMCRKLQSMNLVNYQPYKGATLTEEGGRIGSFILRRHRLWEVFLVEKLGFSVSEADANACMLEHTTTAKLAARLEAFLGSPSVSPEGKPIPDGEGEVPELSMRSLSEAVSGQIVNVVRVDGDAASTAFLAEQGIRAGALLHVLAVGDASFLVSVKSKSCTLAMYLTNQISIALWEDEPKPIPEDVEDEEMQDDSTVLAVRQIPLSELSKGETGIIVKVGGKGAPRRRMMDMGIVSGSEIRVVRKAPLGDPIEYMVKGYSLSLRRSEAKAILVEIGE